MLVFVRSFSYTPHELVLMTSFPYTPDASFSEDFSYTPHASFSEETLLPS